MMSADEKRDHQPSLGGGVLSSSHNDDCYIRSGTVDKQNESRPNANSASVGSLGGSCLCHQPRTRSVTGVKRQHAQTANDSFDLGLPPMDCCQPCGDGPPIEETAHTGPPATRSRTRSDTAASGYSAFGELSRRCTNGSQSTSTKTSGETPSDYDEDSDEGEESEADECVGGGGGCSHANECEEELWEHDAVYGRKQLESADAPLCESEGCRKKACCKNISSKGGVENSCLDHQLANYGGWGDAKTGELPVEWISADDRLAMTQYCTVQDDPVFPDVPTEIDESKLHPAKIKAIKALRKHIDNFDFYKDCKYYAFGQNNKEIRYLISWVKGLVPKGKPAALFAALCDVLWLNGGHSGSCGGSCNPAWDIKNNHSMAVLFGILKSMKDHIQCIDEHQVGTPLINARTSPCPKAKPPPPPPPPPGAKKKRTKRMPCPPMLVAEAKVKSSLFDILIKCCNDLEIDVMLIGIGGDGVKMLWKHIDPKVLASVSLLIKEFPHMCTLFTEGVNDNNIEAVTKLSDGVKRVLEGAGEHQTVTVRDALSDFGGSVSYSVMGTNGQKTKQQERVKSGKAAEKELCCFGCGNAQVVTTSLESDIQTKCQGCKEFHRFVTKKKSKDNQKKKQERGECCLEECHKLRFVRDDYPGGKKSKYCSKHHRKRVDEGNDRWQ